ncbi:MAG TPA: ankyrin repeat domain-containing protein [Arenimonas sp.]
MSTNLFEAIDAADAGAIAHLVAAGADVDEVDLQGFQATPLAYAAGRGAVDMVRALLAAGADPDAAAFTPPLVEAAGAGFTDIVGILLEAGAGVDSQDESGLSALAIAAANGFSGIARQLLEAGANPALADLDGRTPVLAALENGHAKLGAWLGNPETRTTEAFWRKGERLAEKAARARREALASPPADDPGPKWEIKGGMATLEVGGGRVTQDLGGVAGSGDLALLGAMLDGGVSPDWTLFRGHATALMCAARAGEADAVQLLLDRGANVHAVDPLGQTALHFALFKPSARRHLPVLERLIAAGADANTADGNGQRPLHMALRHGMPALVKALIDGGGDPFLRDRAGRCPADWAPESGKGAQAIAALLALVPSAR